VKASACQAREDCCSGPFWKSMLHELFDMAPCRAERTCGTQAEFQSGDIRRSDPTSHLVGMSRLSCPCHPCRPVTPAMAHFCCNVTPEHPVPLVRISSTSSFLQSFGGSGQFLRRIVVLAVTALLQHLRSVHPRAAQFSGCLCISLSAWPASLVASLSPRSWWTFPACLSPCAAPRAV
jgi:hypothetical protein